MTQSTQAPAIDENRLIAERRAKLDALREAGNAYPNNCQPKHQAQQLHAQFGEFEKEALADMASPASVAGRMMLKRVMGKSKFCNATRRQRPHPNLFG